jgi:class 3 adenylate cyclase
LPLGDLPRTGALVAKSISCLLCGVECSETANYCSQCGARLDSQIRARFTSSGATAACELRQLTVMFCDLVGSTKLSLELDAEDFASAVRTYRDACVRVVRHWGGCVSRYIGDGVLIYFGYPRASEDDALRGVAAAWELVHTIPKLKFPNSISRRRALPKLQARIGLHTGLAIVGDLVGTDSGYFFSGCRV